MGNMQITHLGIIKGGEAEAIFRRRTSRSIGSRMCWNDFNDQGLVVHNRGWLRLKNGLKKPAPGHYGGGNSEIGYLRFEQDVAYQLIKNNRAFRLKWMLLWIDEIAAFEFMMGEGYGRPHLNHIYQQWIKEHSEPSERRNQN